MDANRFKYGPVSPASASPVSSAPGVWHALGLIALYFALQLAVGGLVGMAVGVVSILQHHDSITTVVAQGRAWLAHSDATAITVMATLLVSASLILRLARRWWPRLWAQAEPPGLGFTLASPIGMYFAALFVGVLTPVIGGMLTQWLAQGHDVSQDIKQLGANTSLWLRLPLALLVVSLGPLVEELLFRGVLLSSVARHVGNGWSIVLTAVLFACVHLPDLSFLWYALPNLTLLGLMLGWLRVRSGSIWPAVLAHGMNNLLAVVSWFVMTPGH
ncbi:CPBP family intramembrane glutamic endopeptidase [Dyella soli]|uniref:CPBP family intramembrane metalloprotease n=1 Tax=Dyella soli TaxID=522319 RepID=A0A4V2NLX7_9GAMM|nr:CPBP family intramembrane glutamic endopeptidase [Dyella soli]TCI10811.1 CPBP family intramembrane metalloprotease [Dyella soli]